MKHKKYKTKKLIAIITLLFYLVFADYNVAFAILGGGFQMDYIGNLWGIYMPNPMDVLSQILNKYNVDEGGVKNAAQQFNVSQNKVVAPQVSLYFDPSEPKDGQKVTARALPMYFSNPSDKLYYTWYIKHEGESEDSDPNDWKIEAMRIIAQNGYSKDDDPKPDYGVGDIDRDTYFAPLGGGDKISGVPSPGGGSDYSSTPAYCYVHDFSSGTNYKIGQDSDTETKAKYTAKCPTGMTAVCLNTNSSTCKSSGVPTCTNLKVKCDTGKPRCIDNDIIDNSNLYTGDSGKVFSGGTFKYPRVNYVTVDKEGNETADPLVNPYNGLNPPTGDCVSSVESALRYGDAPCFSPTDMSGECFLTKILTDDYHSYYNYVGEGTVTTTCSSTTYTLDYLKIAGWENFMSGDYSEKKRSGFGCDTHAEDYKITAPTACTVTGEVDEDEGCGHLFPKVEGINEVGSGKEFGGKEESFWGTDPNDPNTAGNGNLDEANVAGLGQDAFTWTYRKGDKVGVIVEGTSMIPTKYDDSSYAIMWALPKNIFFGADNDPNSDDNKKYLGTETGYAKGFSFSVPTYNDNPINKSLKYNLVDPAEKSNQRLEVNLSASPDNPENDSSGDEMGDVLLVNSVIGNASQNSSQLRYDWKIWFNNSGKIDGDYKSINETTLKKMIGKTNGINLSSISMNLNLDSSYFDKDGVCYLKIRNVVKENIKKYGKGEIIVKINNSGKRIRAYLMTSKDGKNLIDPSDNLICGKTASTSLNDKLAAYVCPVVKNQIIKLAIDKDGMNDFAWQVNGSDYYCDADVFGGECSDGNVIFLPIVGNEGDEINVTVTGKNMDSEKTVKLTKSFQIVKPYVKIISKDENIFWPKALGNYTDLDGNQYPDFSDSLFGTYPGAENVSLKAEFHPEWLPKTGVISAQWFVDGEEKTNPTNPQEISFSATKDVGEAYNIDFKSTYSASTGIRKVLGSNWKISQLESEGENLSASIKGEVLDIDSPSETSMLKKSGKFLASIISYLPSQFIFLFRIALIIFVVIFLSGLALNLSPDYLRNKK